VRERLRWPRHNYHVVNVHLELLSSLDVDVVRRGPVQPLADAVLQLPVHILIPILELPPHLVLLGRVLQVERRLNFARQPPPLHKVRVVVVELILSP
jgi:hypothetical protein